MLYTRVRDAARCLTPPNWNARVALGARSSERRARSPPHPFSRSCRTWCRHRRHQNDGDRIQDRNLSEIGGKGLFTKEIEEALLDGRIDLAVHSMKDMPTILPPGLMLSAVLPREDARDVLVSAEAETLAALPHGTVIGTSSLRRRAQLLHRRSDLRIVDFRGNVDTRLKKLRDGVADATVLARAGLNRLGRTDVAGVSLSPEEFLPAVAQGIVTIESRESDDEVNTLATALGDSGTQQVRMLNGHCSSCSTARAEPQSRDTRSTKRRTCGYAGSLLRPMDRRRSRASVGARLPMRRRWAQTWGKNCWLRAVVFWRPSDEIADHPTATRCGPT